MNSKSCTMTAKNRFIQLKVLATVLILTVPELQLTAQTRPTNGWIDFGSAHVNRWLQFSPQTMGPNALPVPYTDRALVEEKSHIEIGAHYHRMPGDTAVNSFLSFYWCIAPKKVAVEIWACPTETFHMGNEVRDQRQIYWDDPGWTTVPGDIWISTHVQILRDKPYIPDLVLNYSTKTTTGSSTHARYTDAPLHYFYLAVGKNLPVKGWFFDQVRISGQLGFYVWQTNMVEVSQDEGPMFGLALLLKKGYFSFTSEFSGYSGYDAYRIRGEAGRNNNDPLVFRSKLEAGKKIKGKVEFQTGFRNYPYQTFRLGVVYPF